LHAPSVKINDPEIVSPLSLHFLHVDVLYEDKSAALTGTCIAIKINYIHS